MPIRLLTAVSGKEAAGRHLSAVDLDARQLAVIFRHSIDRAAADRGGPGNSHIKHMFQETTSSELNESPHSGQNFGGCAGSAGVQPHLSHLYCRAPDGFLAPHSVQNLP